MPDKRFIIAFATSLVIVLFMAMIFSSDKALWISLFFVAGGIISANNYILTTVLPLTSVTTDKHTTVDKNIFKEDYCQLDSKIYKAE
jgi:hypothetical protein